MFVKIGVLCITLLIFILSEISSSSDLSNEADIQVDSGAARSFDEVAVDYPYVNRATLNDDILIIDVRQPEEVMAGKIPNSINVPMASVKSVLSDLSKSEFLETYGKTKPREYTEIIFYCKSGKRASMAQQYATSLGYKNAKYYRGSWLDWASKRQ